MSRVDATALDTRELATELAALIGDTTTPPLLDARQAASLLNVPATWLLAEARAGRLPHVRLGRYVRFDHDDLVAWVERRKTGPRPTGRRNHEIRSPR